MIGHHQCGVWSSGLKNWIQTRLLIFFFTSQMSRLTNTSHFLSQTIMLTRSVCNYAMISCAWDYLLSRKHLNTESLVLDIKWSSMSLMKIRNSSSPRTVLWMPWCKTDFSFLPQKPAWKQFSDFLFWWWSVCSMLINTWNCLFFF